MMGTLRGFFAAVDTVAAGGIAARFLVVVGGAA